MKKSAYNFEKFNEQAVMDKNNNPFQYETCYYPEEVAQLGDGHYLAFDILENAARDNGTSYYNKLKFDDYLHHGLMVFVALPLGIYLNSGSLLDHGYFYLTGPPGGINYLLLFSFL